MKTKLLRTIILTGFILLFFTQGQIFSQNGTYHEMTVAGTPEREYLVYEPTGHFGTVEWPVVFVFHGFTGNMLWAASLTEMYLVADTAKFFIVYPQGLPVADLIFGGSGTGWHVPGNYIADHDDVDFVNTIIDDLIDNPDFLIDTNRIHATGYSNGGEMAFYIGCALSSRIASTAGVAAQMAYIMMDSICAPEKSVSVLQMLGTDDPFFPLNGDVYFPPLEGAAEYWASLDNCDPTPNSTTLPNIDPNDGSFVILKDYGSCDRGYEVLCYRIEAGGHAWPGGGQVGEDGVNNDIIASAEIWEFFLRNPHPNCFPFCLNDGITFSSQQAINEFHNGYPHCVEIEGNVGISGNDIVNLDGLLQLEKLGGNLMVNGNDSLLDLSGLNYVSSIGGDLKVLGNQVMVNFTGMEGLLSISGNLQIKNNTTLKNMMGVENLSWIGSDLLIGYSEFGQAGNPSLQSLNGLQNLDSIGGSIKITHNESLATCHVESICGFIIDPDYSDRVLIDNNAVGCDSIGDVSIMCESVTINEVQIENELELFVQPNPFSAHANIVYRIEKAGTVKLTIYGSHGEKLKVIVDAVMEKGGHRIVWNAEAFPTGVYICVLKTEEGIRTVKLIKL